MQTGKDKHMYINIDRKVNTDRYRQSDMKTDRHACTERRISTYRQIYADRYRYMQTDIQKGQTYHNWRIMPYLQIF